jgi:hypothetical protein
MRAERERFLTEQWPPIRDTIERLGLELSELLYSGSKEHS